MRRKSLSKPDDTQEMVIPSDADAAAGAAAKQIDDQVKKLVDDDETPAKTPSSTAAAAKAAANAAAGGGSSSNATQQPKSQPSKYTGSFAERLKKIEGLWLQSRRDKALLNLITEEGKKTNASLNAADTVLNINKPIHDQIIAQAERVRAGSKLDEKIKELSRKIGEAQTEFQRSPYTSPGFASPKSDELRNQLHTLLYQKAVEENNKNNKMGVATLFNGYVMDEDAKLPGIKFNKTEVQKVVESLEQVSNMVKKMELKLTTFKEQVGKIGNFKPALSFGSNIETLSDAIEIIGNAKNKNENNNLLSGQKGVLTDLLNKLNNLGASIQKLREEAKNTNNPAKLSELQKQSQKLQYEIAAINQTLNSEHTRLLLKTAFETEEEKKQLFAFMLSMQHLQCQIPGFPGLQEHDALSDEKVRPTRLDVQAYADLEALITSGKETGFTYTTIEKDNEGKSKRKEHKLVDDQGNQINLDRTQMAEACKRAEQEIKENMKKSGKFSPQEISDYKITFNDLGFLGFKAIKRQFSGGDTYHTGNKENREVLLKHMKGLHHELKMGQQDQASAKIATTGQQPGATVQYQQAPASTASAKAAAAAAAAAGDSGDNKQPAAADGFAKNVMGDTTDSAASSSAAVAAAPNQQPGT